MQIQATADILSWQAVRARGHDLIRRLKLALFKEDQRPNRCNGASHVGAAVLAHVARRGRLDAALRWTELIASFI